eukprot:TRINITY_DN75065_c0_g1_i1.p1 TRINITY_DN75065_c0_g1~~TRINITY_DN75065_c0_g1_i1.p1  ORF type:complete len:728 (-),score=88.65 TRINITY_DN75065_c0_g1_i1:114-2078(-)
MPTRGKWNALRVPSYVQLELEPRFLVGSPYYELPDKADREGMFTLLNRIQELARDIPANEEGSLAALKKVMDEMENLEWSKQDIRSLVTALTAKVDLMQVLASLMNEMQETQWNISRAEAKKEELQRKEEHCLGEGEVDMASTHVYDRLKVHEDIFRLCYSKLDNIALGIDKCLQQRNSQVNQWKQGAASIEVLREAKQKKRALCEEDVARLDRGMEYEARQAQLTHEKYEAELKDNDAELQTIVNHIKEHVVVLERLAEEWKAEEEQIKRLIQQRQSVIGARLQLIMNEAQRQADFQEFLEYCGNHQSYLHGTDSMCNQADEALKVLQQFTTGSSRFLDQDFHSTKHQLSEMKVNTLKQVVLMHSDCYKDIKLLMNKKGHRLKTIDEQIIEAEMNAERCKETFDPMCKKFVEQQHRLIAERENEDRDHEWLKNRMATAEEHFKKAAKELEEFGVNVEHPAERVEWLQAMRDEELLDHRDRQLESDADRILHDRDVLKLQENKAKEDQHIRKQTRAAFKYEQNETWTVIDGAADIVAKRKDDIAQLRQLNSTLQGVKKTKREPRMIASASIDPASMLIPAAQHYSPPKQIEPVAAPTTTSPPSHGAVPVGGEQSSLALALGGSFRSTPLDLARQRRAEPRTIDGPKPRPGAPLD